MSSPSSNSPVPDARIPPEEPENFATPDELASSTSTDDEDDDMEDEQGHLTQDTPLELDPEDDDDDEEEDEGEGEGEGEEGEEDDEDAEPHFPLVIGAVLRFPENRKFPLDFELEVDDLMRAILEGRAMDAGEKRIDNLLGEI